MKANARSKKCPVPLALAWSHSGIPCRVTPWPELRFERLYGEEWIALDPSEEMLASAAQSCGTREWTTFMEFMPEELRAFLEQFTLLRMPALLVAARCPQLMADLAETPALVPFVAAHMRLRGTKTPRWDEISVVHEREGLFGVLQWLGLPASRQTLSILRHVDAPDLPRKLLEPLRAALWEPETIWVLSHAEVLTDTKLQAACHALAA
ncbi:MAG: hypothetical protein V4773_02860 [Verrucomicrobiota bacterium]